MFGSQDRPIKAMTIDEVSVRLLGNVAVVTCRTMAVGSDGAAVKLRFTDVVAERAGQWQVAASHGTRIAE
jgi:hypothetical protein